MYITGASFLPNTLKLGPYDPLTVGRQEPLKPGLYSPLTVERQARVKFSSQLAYGRAHLPSRHHRLAEFVCLFSWLL